MEITQFQSRYCFEFHYGFCSGSWLLNLSYSKYFISGIFTGSWFIWKTHYNEIFKGIHPNYNVIICRAIAYGNEFVMQSLNLFGRKLILNNFSKVASNFIFIYMNRSPHKRVSSVRFFLANANYAKLVVGFAPFPMDTSLTNDLTTMNITLQVALDL